MKKVNITKGAALLAVVLLALISLGTCSHGGGGSSPASNDRGTLRVIFDFSHKNTQKKNILSLGSLTAARTVHPVISTDTFDSYILNFTPQGGGTAVQETVQVTINSEPGVAEATVSLAVGTYTISAEAKKGSDVLAQGSIANVSVTTGTNADASITMGPNVSAGGNGDFSYALTVPAGTNSGLLTLQLNGPTVGDAVTLTPGQANSGTKTGLSVGSYYVFVQLTNAAGSTAGLAEVLHIYKGLTSSLTKTYTDSDFAPPTAISAADLTSFFAAPQKDVAPVRSFGTTASQYTGTIQWKTGNEIFTGTAFAASAAYTAVVSLTANPGSTLTGVGANFFTHANATAHSNDANSGVVTLTFPATGGPDTGSQGVTIGFNYGTITVEGAGGTIYKTGSGSPTSLLLRVENYETYLWYIDGNASNPLSGNPLVIQADDYSVQTHTASFIGRKDGFEYSQSVSFTVAGSSGSNEPPPPAGNLTADINFYSTDYASGTAFDTNGWTGSGTAAQGWSLSAVEQSTVYFAVAKTAAQTVTLGGTDASIVTMAESGSVAGALIDDDSLEASSSRTVFTVNTADLVFEGGIKTFTLTVSEAGKDPKTVTVSLNVVANTTGAALFLVSRQGGVETLTRKDTGPIENGPADTTAPAAFTGLYDALVWVDKNTATEQEWLIRVEAAETQIPRMVLACRTDTTNHASNVTIRLRGMGTGERIIKHDESSTAYKGRGITNTVLSNSWGFISLRGMSRDESTPGITFQLEKNITLKGTVDHLADSNNHYRFMFLVHEKSVLKLMAGSKITGYYTGGTSGGIDFSMIELGDKNNRWSSQYRLVIEAGAEISGNSFVTDPDATDQSGHARLVHVLIGGTNPYYPPPSSPIISIASGAVITNNGSELTNCVTFGTALNTMHNYPLSAGTAYILPIPEHLGQ